MFKRIIKEECKVPADIKYLGEMRDFITHVGRKYGVSEGVINSFKLAIDEAATNIIRHAYRDWDGFVTLRMAIKNRDISVSLIDQGHTFDPRRVRDPDLQRYVDIGKKGGLGIFIIRRVVDAIDYRKTVEGNELKLIKHNSMFPRRRLHIPGAGLSLKIRYSVFASVIFTVAVVLLWFITNSQQKSKILKADLTTAISLAKTLAHQSIDPLIGEKTYELARIAAEFQRDHSPLVLEAMVVDSADTVQGALKTESILEPFLIPRKFLRTAESVIQYHAVDGREVYDVSEPIIPKGLGIRIGQIHLLIDKKVIDKKIITAQEQNFRLFSGILIFGYLGILGLILLITSPLKRLVRWINAAGQGEVQEEVEFDQSDEIGEIAHAFSEITEKFRKSQENVAEQERLQKEMQVAPGAEHLPQFDERRTEFFEREPDPLRPRFPDKGPGLTAEQKPLSAADHRGDFNPVEDVHKSVFQQDLDDFAGPAEAAEGFSNL
jgi:anti-sigma regulatory factor (Ser/Thr protein kinase)